MLFYQIIFLNCCQILVLGAKIQKMVLWTIEALSERILPIFVELFSDRNLPFCFIRKMFRLWAQVPDLWPQAFPGMGAALVTVQTDSTYLKSLKTSFYVVVVKVLMDSVFGSLQEQIVSKI